MSKIGKFKFETDGWYDGSIEDYYDPGYNLLELWQYSSDDDSWELLWESSAVDGDEIGGSDIIKAELLEALPNFGLTLEDVKIDSDSIHDWEIL